MYNYLAHLNNSSFLRPDGILPISLKFSADDLSFLLTTLFNRFMQMGCLPNNHEIALIFPTHTGGSHHGIDNYQPINNAYTISELFKTTARDAFNTHLWESNLLSPA